MEMGPRIFVRRILVLRPLKGQISNRFFTRHTSLPSRNRPQIPFLSVPVARNQQHLRYLTTERKRWLMYEVYLGFKYTVYLWAIAALSCVIYWGVKLEWMERRYPSPHEWRILTRHRFRMLMWDPDRGDSIQTNWVEIANYALNIMERLEDEKIDGAGLRDLLEGGLWIDGIGKAGYDITAKSEPWRRGYYQVLMMCAKAAEQLDSHVIDKERHIVFPADQVMGPSNPYPKPIPHGSPSAPHEKDCERFFEPPETYYLKILTTKGFTSKQKMDAALDYASWLDFKGMSDASERMHEWALQLATENTHPDLLPLDPESHVLLDKGRQPSKNLLTSLTALAVHKARQGDISAALPILVSILRARRGLPKPPPKSSATAELAEEKSNSPWTMSNILSTIKSVVVEYPYPPAPDDGEPPPVRDAKELCEEAGLNLYIGEIIYASKSGSSGREDGLAWTREAVDIAEEQLHKITQGEDDDDAAKKTCRECLNTGLDNWSKMVARLAKEEKEKQENSQSKSSWLSLWGDASPAQGTGRWAAEENVVKERIRRSQDILDELEAPKAGFWSLFWA